MRGMIFDAADADGWFERNHAVLAPEHTDTDPLCAALRRHHVLTGRGKVVAELGCSTGWRLAGLQREYPDHEYRGLELSPRAVAAGAELYPEIILTCGSAEAAPWPTAAADVVLINFVLHWIARERLDAVRLEVSRLLRPGGLLAVVDFWPVAPTQVVYHHRPVLSTWKERYADLWLGTGDFALVAEEAFPDAATAERCGIWLLQQGGTRG